MPSELRYIMFTETEIKAAALDYLSSKSVLLPGTESSKANLEAVSASSLIISFVKDEFGKRERRVMTSHEVIEALILWCRSKAVALPFRAQKDLIKIGPVLCMRIALNVPEKNIGSVETLLLNAARGSKAAA